MSFKYRKNKHRKLYERYSKYMNIAVYTKAPKKNKTKKTSCGRQQGAFECFYATICFF